MLKEAERQRLCLTEACFSRRVCGPGHVQSIGVTATGTAGSMCQMGRSASCPDWPPCPFAQIDPVASMLRLTSHPSVWISLRATCPCARTNLFIPMPGLTLPPPDPPPHPNARINPHAPMPEIHPLAPDLARLPCPCAQITPPLTLVLGSTHSPPFSDQPPHQHSQINHITPFQIEPPTPLPDSTLDPLNPMLGSTPLFLGPHHFPNQGLKTSPNTKPNKSISYSHLG